jgi:hypothetical protein
MPPGILSNPTGILSTSSPRRRTLFFFHHGNDIWRVNQVRNAWRFVTSEDQESLGFFDASIWERTKSEGDEAIRNLIRRGIANTSVTCVLAGTYTYQRRWVRYEIARSIIKHSGLLTVKIHGLRDNASQVGFEGPDPLDCMGVYRDEQGRLLLADFENGSWRAYPDYTTSVTLPPGWEQPGQYLIRLSRYSQVYDYVAAYGSTSLGEWIATAAANAGR